MGNQQANGQVRWDDFQLVIFKGRSQADEFNSFRENAYRFWHKHWAQIFKEKRSIPRLTSDHFQRQTEVAALLHQNETVAVFCYDWTDISAPSSIEHSYFDPYPAEVREKLLGLGIKKAMVLSYLAVDESFRKHNLTPSAAEIMIGLAVKRFEHSMFKDIIGYARNPRKTNSILYDFGALPVIKDLVAWDEPSDFIRFNRDYSITFANKNVHASIVQSLWDGRLHEVADAQLFQLPINQGDTL